MPLKTAVYGEHMKFRITISAMLIFAVAIASAQTFRGGIQGVVTDTSNAAVAQAHVKVVNDGTGLERTTETDASGNYTVTELPLGSYSVTVTKQGFGTKTSKGVRVEVSTNQRLDVTLALGQVQEQVEVVAD